ncbi:MAG: ABC transporter ATP-binding protein [FCB group bacterium]|jgi:ABC-2 type transport system ATP-binding protein|nr:ABC transporter ATP-binding protein [FCB group bacterium]
MSAVIEATDLSKWFGEVVAVNNLQVSIGPGVTGLLGPNGAGKTTFIKLALGIYRPSRGNIRLFGEAPRNNLPLLRRIAYCPESDTFHEGATGYEFVYWLARYSGLTARAARAGSLECIEQVGMTARMHDPIGAYSRGMRQRIKIAQALVSKPDLLFLDEPLAGLDPRGREQMYSLVRAIGDEGRTVIMSSHILYEIERVTSKVVLLHNGAILADGRVRDIREMIDEHAHAVTVECGDPRELAEHFVADEATLAVNFEGRTLTIQTRDPNGFYHKLNALILAGEIEVTAFHCPDDNLQSVFHYLLEK